MTRLKTVQSMITRVEVFADVGCDHGLISKFVLSSGLCDRLIASDISAPSLNKARQLLLKFNNVEFVCCDGFRAYMDKVDLSVIAGMGGLNIIDILRQCPVTVDSVIVQPQNNAPLLRRYISGFASIVDDRTAFERGKYYDVFKFVSGGTTYLDEISEIYGMNYKTANALLKARVQADLTKYRSFFGTKDNLNRIRICEEVLKWQQ